MISFSTEKLSSIVRSIAASDQQSVRSLHTPTQTTWDNQTVVRPPSRSSSGRLPSRDRRSSGLDSGNARDGDSNARDSINNGSSKESRESRERVGKYGPPSRGVSHSRNGSETTGTTSSLGYTETSGSGPLRRHEYDVQSMESSLISPRSSVTKNPIPPPTVSVRSEFPTLYRSRHQQTLTCLVTVEVPANKWSPDPGDLRSGPPTSTLRPEDTYARPPSPAQSAPRVCPYEQPEVLEEITQNLRGRVDNWHGLDFNRYVCFVIAARRPNDISDSASCAFTVHFELVKIDSRGRNWSASCSARCSFA